VSKACVCISPDVWKPCGQPDARVELPVFLARWQGDREEHPITQSYLNQYALFKAQSKDYVRQSQGRLILQPIGDHKGHNRDIRAISFSPATADGSLTGPSLLASSGKTELLAFGM
jgi:hypothetical protein